MSARDVRRCLEMLGLKPPSKRDPEEIVSIDEISVITLLNPTTLWLAVECGEIRNRGGKDVLEMKRSEAEALRDKVRIFMRYEQIPQRFREFEQKYVRGESRVSDLLKLK